MNMPLEKYRPFFVWLFLAVIITGAAFHRAERFKELSYYDIDADIGSFYTEEAFQFRHTRMVADDEPIPLFDKKPQWPEGVTPFRELTLLQEYLHGLSFRLFSGFFPNVPLYTFLVYFIAFFSCLTVPAVFLCVRALGGRPWPALYISALYAFSGAAFGRVQFYELEATAFPLMTLSFAACLYALRGRPYPMVSAVFSGVCLTAALVCWHFTRFYLLMLWAAMAGAFLFTGGKRHQFNTAVVILVFVAAAGVLSPVMRTSGLLFSPAVLTGVLVVIVLFIDTKISLNFFSRLSLLASGVVLILLIFSPGTENSVYGHVWGLFKYKLSNLLVKPDNPGMLPFEGRILWNGPFNSPPFFFLIYRFGLLLPLALMALARFIKTRRRQARFDELMVAFLAVMFLVANIMAQRLIIFSVFFLGTAVAFLFLPDRVKTGSVPDRAVFLKPSRLSGIMLAVCLIFQVREAVLWDNTYLAKTVRQLGADNSRPRLAVYAGDEKRMLDWIRHHTPDTAVFLSNIENSPSILAYTGRAINQHPKMEAENIREKHRKILLTLFGQDEGALYRMFDDLETDYYLYPIRNLLQADPDGKRYLAGLSKVPRNNLTYRLHFRPDSFRRLRLVYRNRSYQIFQVLDTDKAKAACAGYAVPYFPVYDPVLFKEPAGPSDGWFNDTHVRDVTERVDYAIQTMNRAEKWLSAGDRRMTMKLIQQALTVGLPDGEAYYRAADFMLWLGNPEWSLAFIRRAMAYEPDNVKFKNMLTQVDLVISRVDAGPGFLSLRID